MKLWDFNKIHCKSWQVNKDHFLEVQLDYWKEGPRFNFGIEQRDRTRHHPGIRFSVALFHWEFSVEYYSIHHADRAPRKDKEEKDGI